MKEVLENVNNYVVIIDENEIIKFCNEKFAKKINYSKDELLEGKITEKLLYKNHFFYNIKNSFKILNESFPDIFAAGIILTIFFTDLS